MVLDIPGIYFTCTEKRFETGITSGQTYIIRRITIRACPYVYFMKCNIILCYTTLIQADNYYCPAQYLSLLVGTRIIRTSAYDLFFFILTRPTNTKVRVGRIMYSNNNNMFAPCACSVRRFIYGGVSLTLCEKFVSVRFSRD